METDYPPTKKGISLSLHDQLWLETCQNKLRREVYKSWAEYSADLAGIWGV